MGLGKDLNTKGALTYGKALLQHGDGVAHCRRISLRLRKLEVRIAKVALDRSYQCYMFRTHSKYALLKHLGSQVQILEPFANVRNLDMGTAKVVENSGMEIPRRIGSQSVQGLLMELDREFEIDTAILSPGTEKIVEQIPMQRLGTTDEVAKIIYVLCTDTSSYVNGAEIHINGGQHV